MSNQAANSNSRILLVPAGDDDVPISLDELPSMQDDEWEVIISLLSGDSSSSRPHASLWTRMAFEYFNTDRKDHAIELLTKGTQILRGTDSASTLHSMLSFFYLNKVKDSPKTILNNPKYQDLRLSRNQEEEIKEKSFHLNDSSKHSANASALSPRHQTSILNKALLLLENGKNDECLNQLAVVLNSQPRHTVALFAKACILLRKKNYQSALLIYQSLLKLTLDIDQKANQKRERQAEMQMDLDDGMGNQQEGGGGGAQGGDSGRWKGPDPRIGIGLCLLGLNRPSDAIRAWERAAALNPSSSAPNLLLGLTALNTAKQLAPLQPGAYGYSPSLNGEAGIGGCSEEEARQKAYKHGIDHIQKAWKGDNKNAMTAIILAEHISSRASSLSSSPDSNSSDIMNQFNKALKLCEHAIQYADNRPAFIQASLIFARTSHLASNVAAKAAASAFDPTSIGGSGEMGNESVELRAQAQRNYQRVIDDLLSQTSSNSLSSTSTTSSSQPLNVVGGGNVLPNGLALAVLGLAQLQVLRNEELAAMNTLDLLLNKNWSNSLNYPLSSLLEPNILASSLRYFSHPGASALQKSSDFSRAKVGLERTLRIINATCREVYLRLNSGDANSEETEESKTFKMEISKEEEEEEKTWESKRIVEGVNDNIILSRAVARTSLINEPLSLNSFKNIANLFNSTNVHVLMAQLCQRGQSDSDVERSIQEWKVAAEKESARLGIDLKDLKDAHLKDEDLNDLVCCLINQNALLVLKGLEEKPDWDPLAKPHDTDRDQSSALSRSTFSNPTRTEILTEAVQNLESVLNLLSKIESSKPSSNSTTQFFSSAISNASNQLEVDPLRLIISYNLARALEGLAEEARAVKIYDEILEKHSEYADAKVRKALIYLGGSSKSYSSKDGIISTLLCNPKQGPSPSKLVSSWNRDLSNSLFKEALLSNPSSLSIRLSYVSFLSGSLPCSRSSNWSIVKDILAEPFLGSTPQGVQLFGSASTAKSTAETARKDSFTLAALGWVYYNLALQAKPGPNFKKEREKGMLRSSDLFDKALTEDSRNCFAAQGLAILLAEDAVGEATFNAINSGSLNTNTKDSKLNNVNQQLLGQVKYLTGMSVDQRRKLGADESLSILGKLRELKDSEHVQICIGHANMMKEEFERASKAFEQASNRYLCDSDPTVLQQLSRANYAQATRTSSFELLEASLEHLKSALVILESRLSADEKNPALNAEVNFVRYNIAVISQKGLSMLYEKKFEKRDRGMIERAVKNVEEAQRIFESLAPIAAESKLAHITAEILDQRSQYGSTSLLRVATRHLNDQIAYETRVAAAREEVANAKREKEARILAQRREAEENLREKNRLLAEQRKKEKEEVGTWEYRKDLPEDGKRRTGEKRRSKKRKDDADREGIEMDTDGELDDELFGPSGQKDGDLSSGESDLNDENKLKRREERINDLKRKKINEKKRNSSNGEKKKKQKKEKKVKKKKGPQLSDGEEEGDGGDAEDGVGASDSGSESDAPKRKKPKKALSKKMAAQEDIIDSDEEI